MKTESRRRWASRGVNGWCCAAGLLATLAACGPQTEPSAVDDGLTCEQRKQQLLAVLGALPTQGLAVPIGVPLATSTLSGTFGGGPLVELSYEQAAFNGRAVAGETHEQRAAELGRLVARSVTDGKLYIAAAQSMDIRTLNQYLAQLPKTLDLSLLFAASVSSEDLTTKGEPVDLATRVLAERDVAKRHALAAQGYEQYSSCDATTRAAASVNGVSVKERWPRLQSAMLQAVPQCDCDAIDAPRLRRLLVAEQRAGSVALGSLPANFLRDLRCSASMHLTSVQRLLKDIEEFDEEFSGDWKQDALVFDRVVTDERLLNYLCVALPGETLASLQRANGSLYWRVGPECQSWRFEPLSPGAPMGTLRRTSAGANVAFHYWQAVEEIRLFGPEPDPRGKPTDEGPWACTQNFHMVKVDGASVHLAQGGQWFFDEDSCRQASASTPFQGCVAQVAAGLPLPPPVAEVSDPPPGGSAPTVPGSNSSPPAPSPE